MQIFVKGFDGKTLTFNITDPNDRFIDLKRIIRNKIGGNPEEIYCWRVLGVMKNSKNVTQFDDYDVIHDKLNPETSLQLLIRLGGAGGPQSEEIIIKTDIEGYEDFKPCTLKFSTAHNINNLLEYMTEALYAHKNHKMIVNDFQITFNDEVLHPNKKFAEYKQLSRSHIQYNMQEKIINNKDIKGFMISKFGFYYQHVIVGDGPKPTPQLIFTKRTVVNYPPINNNCELCTSQDYIILPCCRKKICNQCFKEDITKCVLCNKVFLQ